MSNNKEFSGYMKKDEALEFEECEICKSKKHDILKCKAATVYRTNGDYLVAEINSLKALNASLVEALKELLPMQGCIRCQELYMHCDSHGYIVDTIDKCEAILKAHGGGK